MTTRDEDCPSSSYAFQWAHVSCFQSLTIYRIAGNFREVLIFVIFVTIPRVTKFSTHEIFHPRIFSRLLRIIIYIGLRESRNLKPRKLILKTRDSFSRKFAPPKITRYTVLSMLLGHRSQARAANVTILNFKRAAHCTAATQPDSSYLPSFTVATSRR